jgi:hypothetical protein
MKENWIFSKAFSESIEMVMWFCLWFCLCTVLHLLICVLWTILTFLKWSHLNHGIWSFLCVVQLGLQVFYWGLLHLCSSRELTYSFLITVVPFRYQGNTAS